MKTRPSLRDALQSEISLRASEDAELRRRIDYVNEATEKLLMREIAVLKKSSIKTMELLLNTTIEINRLKARFLWARIKKVLRWT